MKNMIKLSFASLLLTASFFVANAQKKIAEGTITYAIEYNLPADKQAMAAMLPQEYKVSFNGSSSKFKMEMGMFSTLVIYNGSTHETLSLTEVPIQNKKIAVKMNKEQTEKMAEMQGTLKDLEISATEETKVINGFNCKKYVCTDKDSGAKMDVWATNDIELPLNSITYNFKELKAVPIQFSSDARGMKSKITVKSISEDKVGDILMEIPKEFETMSFEDLMKQMGG